MNKQTELVKLIVKDNKYFDWSNDKRVVLQDAVNFGEDAYRLAGPFLNEYGLVTIYHEQDSETLKEINDKQRKDAYKTIIFFPNHIQAKLYKAFGINGENRTKFYYNVKTKTCISSVDVLAGAELTEDYESSETTLFAETEKGLELLFSVLSDSDKDEITKVLEPRIEEWERENEIGIPHKEKPYLVYLCGTDDTSYSKAVTSYKDAILLLQDLKNYGFSTIDEQMIFTN